MSNKSQARQPKSVLGSAIPDKVESTPEPHNGKRHEDRLIDLAAKPEKVCEGGVCRLNWSPKRC